MILSLEHRAKVSAGLRAYWADRHRAKQPPVITHQRPTLTEQEVIDRYSTPGLKRNVISRATKKLNMEFDERFKGMSKKDREDFLNDQYPEWPTRSDS